MIILQVELMEAVFTIDETGKIISCNQNFVQALFGYSNSELIGKLITTLIPQLHQNTHSVDVFGSTVSEPERKKQKLEKTPNSEYSWKTPGIHRKEVLHRDGSTFPVMLEIYPISDRDGKAYSVRIKRADLDKDNSSEAHKMIGNYYVIKTVGQGSYGKVKLACHKDTKENVAIKILQKVRMKPQELDRARRETEILKKLKHPHIAKLFDVLETEENMYIIMEYAGRTLLAYVLERGGLGETSSRKFFIQIASAVKYCHDLSIIHRDIKHQNILLDDQDNCKLIDFGLSNFMEEGKMRSTFCGTPAYAAPEMILGKKYNGPEVDIWSLGVVLYSMITGVFPFENVGDIIKGSYKDPKDCTEACCDLLKKMLQVDITTRVTLDQILEHTWCKDEQKPLKEIECTVVSTNSSEKEVPVSDSNSEMK